MWRIVMKKPAATSFISAKEDFVFKWLFGTRRNIDLTKALLQAVLDLPKEEYGHLSFPNTHLLRRWRNDKLGILDVRIHTTSGNIINVEIQARKKADFRSRIIYYIARLIEEQAGWGQSFDKIKRVISIIIMDFDLVTENSDYHNRFFLYDPDTKTRFSDIIELHTLELGKMSRNPDGSRLWDWLEFIKAEDEEEREMLAERNMELGRAAAEIKRMGLYRNIRARLLSIQMAKIDAYLEKKYEREEGRAEGRVEGRTEGRAEGEARAEARFAARLEEKEAEIAALRARLEGRS
jgi:predicted transposase/invertase (TIGR01784 family)